MLPSITSAVGDYVEEDEVIAEIETDKVNLIMITECHSSPPHLPPPLPPLPQTALQVPAPVSGVLEELLVADGDTVTAGMELARIRVSGIAVADSSSSARVGGVSSV